MLEEEVIKKDIGLRGDSINEMAMISTELSERHIGVRGDMWMRQGAIKSEIVSDRDSIIRIVFIDLSGRFSEAIDFVWRPELQTLSSGQSRKEEKHNIYQLLLSNFTRTPISFKYFPDSFYKISNIIYEEK